MWDMIELSTGTARADQALAMLNNRTDTSNIDEANAILDELCLDRRAAERLIRSRMPPRADARPKTLTAGAIAASPRDAASLRRPVNFR